MLDYIVIFLGGTPQLMIWKAQSPPPIPVATPEFCTYGTRVACTSQSAPAPRHNPRDLTSASSAVFGLPSHMSHYTHSIGTRVTEYMGWYLQTQQVYNTHTTVSPHCQFISVLFIKSSYLMIIYSNWFILMQNSLISWCIHHSGLDWNQMYMYKA